MMNASVLGGGSLLERDARVIANIGRLRFSPLSLVGGFGNYLIEEGVAGCSTCRLHSGRRRWATAIRRSRKR